MKSAVCQNNPSPANAGAPFAQGSLSLSKPPLCKGRWIRAAETEGLSLLRDSTQGSASRLQLGGAFHAYSFIYSTHCIITA